jgi:ATP-dependent Clp protease ATP-binding subunit ClpC
MFERFTGRARHVVVLAQQEGPVPFTPRAKTVLELAMRDLLRSGRSYIGTEHILRGLVRKGASVPARVLDKLGADLTKIRRSSVY